MGNGSSCSSARRSKPTRYSSGLPALARPERAGGCGFTGVAATAFSLQAALLAGGGNFLFASASAPRLPSGDSPHCASTAAIALLKKARCTVRGVSGVFGEPSSPSRSTAAAARALACAWPPARSS
eukprot:jgi/Chrpa1/25903/Chrysochromulina_OHIO_Genome00011900-RA